MQGYITLAALKPITTVRHMDLHVMNDYSPKTPRRVSHCEQKQMKPHECFSKVIKNSTTIIHTPTVCKELEATPVEAGVIKVSSVMC